MKSTNTKEKLIPILKLFQKIEKERKNPNSFYEDQTTLMPKVYKVTRRKKKKKKETKANI